MATWRQPLTVHLSVVFSVLLIVACAAIGSHDYWQARRIALIAAEDLSRPVLRGVGSEVERLFGSVTQLANLLAASQVVDATDDYTRLLALPLLTRALDANPDVSAVYIGRDDGSFHYVLALRAGVPAPVPLPTGTAYATRQVTSQSDAAALERWTFYDANLEPVGQPVTGRSTYDPRKRPWYIARGADKGPVMTEPYMFDASREAGATAARRNELAGAVVGVDVRLARLGEILAAERLTPRSDLALVDARRRVIATSRSGAADGLRENGSPALPDIETAGTPILAAARRVLEGDRRTPLTDVEVDGELWKVGTHAATIDGGGPIDVVVAIPTAELLVEINAVRRETIGITLLMAAIAVPVVVVISMLAARRLRRLEAGARAVRSLRFEANFTERSRISEIDELGHSLQSMQDTIQRFLEIGRALMNARSMDSLFERVLTETVAAAHAKHGMLLLVDGPDKPLVAARAATATGEQEAIPDAVIPLLVCLDQPGNPVARAAARRHTTVSRTANTPEADRILDLLGIREGALITVPLFDRDGELLGAVCLAVSEDTPVSSEMLNFVEALCGSSAVAIENARLVQAQKELLEAFIRLVASAIDAKSAYTGGHCQRVPELTLALATAANTSQAATFANYHLNEEELEELRLAAWLHDCGKVTTPEWVVDKATRLECVHNRIHEIRTRFEVLWRDTEIAALRETLADPTAASAAAARCREAQEALVDDFAFVAASNLGSTVMDADRIERLKSIASRQWVRHFDDRLGLAADELGRQPPATGLPVMEALLADKPSHRIPQPGIIPDYLAAGFRAAAPAYAFDQGELHNLSIPRGTLTDEERFKINEHVMQTILMLRRLPLPRGLRNVPIIAGAHHEQLNGNGYPAGLNAEHLSVSQRILAVADVFEALTATDRPYKSPKTIAEALKIMRFMVKDGHLDGDVVDLLEHSGVASAYEARWLATPAQPVAA